MTCTCEALEAKLAQIEQLVIAQNAEIAALKSQLNQLQSISTPDLSPYLKKSELEGAVCAAKNPIVSCLMTATTWAEIPITINLADYISTD